MLKIAVCDDNEFDKKKILSSLYNIEESWKENFEILSFSNGRSLYNSLSGNEYNIIFLDIIMENFDGIEIAKKIRISNDETSIIFISNCDRRFREMFPLKVTAFLDKPFELRQLENVLKEAYDKIKKDYKKIFSYSKNGSLRYIEYNKIIYFSVQGHYITMKIIEQEIKYKGKISQVWDQLIDRESFCKPNRSYIVNLKYMSILKDKILIDKLNEEISIGRSFKKDTLARFINYINNKWE